MALDPAAFFVDPDVSKARSLPPEAFLSREYLARELETVFASSWLLVPERPASEMREDKRSMADLVARRGARAPVSMLDKPLFVQRDWKGQLRAFPNVCTHAWHTLVQGPDRARTITCPQHGRQFDAMGKCLGQPGFASCLPADDLRAFPAQTFGGLTFACLGEPAERFDRVMAPVKASLAKLPVDRLKRMPQAGEVRELDGNWKQFAWNYMDKFHIPYLHKKPGGLADAIDYKSYQTELYSDAALQWVYALDPAHGFDEKALPVRFKQTKDRRVFALWWLVFPNLALNFYPWGLSVNAYMPVPDEPHRTLFLWYHFAWDAKKYEQRESIWLNTDVDLEDVDAMGQVGRGVASGLAQRGRFAPGEEDGPHWFHRMCAERTLGQFRATPPLPKRR